MAPRYLGDMCPKLSWKSMNLEKNVCHEAFSLLASMWGIWAEVVKPTYHWHNWEFSLTLAKEVLIRKDNVFFYPPAQLSSLELWSGWFEKNNLAFIWNHCLPDATFETFIQFLNYFLPNSVSRVKTDSLLSKWVCEYVYFFWKCLRCNQFLWDVSPKIKFPFPPSTLAAGMISVVLTLLPLFPFLFCSMFPNTEEKPRIK